MNSHSGELVSFPQGAWIFMKLLCFYYFDARSHCHTMGENRWSVSPDYTRAFAPWGTLHLTACDESSGEDEERDLRGKSGSGRFPRADSWAWREPGRGNAIDVFRSRFTNMLCSYLLPVFRVLISAGSTASFSWFQLPDGWKEDLRKVLLNSIKSTTFFCSSCTEESIKKTFWGRLCRKISVDTAGVIE